MKKLLWILFKSNLIVRMLVCMIIGAFIAAFLPQYGVKLEFLGRVFIQALRAAAPILVFVLVISSIVNNKFDNVSSIKSVAWLYAITVLISAILASTVSYLYPLHLVMDVPPASEKPPEGVAEILMNIILKFVDNPIDALATGNFLSILAWSTALGIALRHSSEATKSVIKNWSDATIWVVRLVVAIAPYGVLGLVASHFTSDGLAKLKNYLELIGVLLGLMVFVALVINPLIVFLNFRKNPYPLVFTCLRYSGITAFFTRSSAANIPVNIRLAQRMQLPEEIYSLSIPLGVTMSMNGAAITITTMTMATVHTLGMDVSFIQTLLLSILATVCALGASGVPGGSLLLIPVACSMFGIDPAIAAQVVAIGFVISEIQDSAETVLNSSSDMLFTSVVSLKQQGRDPSKIELLPE
ncbi:MULTISPECIES: serine/threonine transporter SstT [Snodgrassella]|uniref:serine/threonine transporter SstT n=1 Tax=Snodgrassella TaxID=1193515 RepID=UPI00226ACAF5|nr:MULTISPECIES: serine/threonine transporter SstT [unclassified Snodgrassella]MCX8746960.1 serine/threonine transporter SstT [Snodgrassella sp. B3800]MCX8748723.1 serine/threonine transporter SstT [Snodgrassella sp. B3088]MCX8753374.1 serine/threonine transporter SstT [Snodgrassella sp. B3837]